MFKIPSRCDDAVGEFKIPIQSIGGSLERGLVYWQILGVENLPNRFMRDSGPQIELEDPVELLGPIVFVRQQIRDEAARFAHSLSFGETKVGLLDLRLSSFAIIDVGKEKVPDADLAFGISHREAAPLNPPVHAISPPAAVLYIIDLSGFDGSLSLLDHVRQVIWVNGINESPILQLLLGLAEIFQRLAVEKLDLAHSPGRSNKPRNAIDDLTPRKFACKQGFLSTFAILNVDTGSVPFEDLAGFSSQRLGANQERSIRAVEASNPGFSVDRGARSKRRLPHPDKFFTVIRMNRLGPPPALRLLRGLSRVIEPHLIEEVAVAVRTSGPCRRGNRIDDGGKITLACPQRLFRLFTVLDISAGAVPPYDLAGLVQERLGADEEPTKNPLTTDKESFALR